MAIISNSRTFRLPAPLRLASALLSGVMSWNDERITRRTLGKLTARELDDLGLCRGDIDAVARGDYR